MRSFFEIIPFFEPAIVFIEANFVLGYRGSLCRGEYEDAFILSFYQLCGINEQNFTYCKDKKENYFKHYDYLKDLGNWYKVTIYLKVIILAIQIVANQY